MALDVLDSLLNNLRETHGVYRRLLDVAEEKKAHILASDLDGLREDLEAEATLAEKGAGLNAARDELHRHCCETFHVDTGGRMLEDLSEFLPDDWRGPFDEERSGLRKTLETLRDRNRMNMVLVNNSLELMEGLLAAMSGTETVRTYGRRGKRVNGGPPVRALDAKA